MFAWWATVHGVAKSQRWLKGLSARTHNIVINLCIWFCVWTVQNAIDKTSKHQTRFSDASYRFLSSTTNSTVHFLLFVIIDENNKDTLSVCEVPAPL